MFRGITSHHDAKRVTSYETAELALERASLTPTGKRRTEKEKGFHLGLSRNHGVTWVKRYSDGSIGFTLYETEVVMWQPDNSVLIDNFGTVTTTGFASRFTPARIHLRHLTETRGDKGIGYVQGDDRRVCHGGIVRFVEDANGDWVPDETTCDPIDLPVLDRKLAHATAKDLNLVELAAFLRVAPFTHQIEHDEFDLDECCAALRRREFRRAAELLPPIKPGSGFGLEERVAAVALPMLTRRDEYITMGSIDKLKLAYWSDMGYFDTVRHTTIGQKAYANGMARVRALAAVGCYGSWGPNA